MNCTGPKHQMVDERVWHIYICTTGTYAKLKPRVAIYVFIFQNVYVGILKARELIVRNTVIV